jgi:hypothetical protein
MATTTPVTAPATTPIVVDSKPTIAPAIPKITPNVAPNIAVAIRFLRLSGFITELLILNSSQETANTPNGSKAAGRREE